jgi:hypothetical protein
MNPKSANNITSCGINSKKKSTFDPKCRALEPLSTIPNDI